MNINELAHMYFYEKYKTRTVNHTIITNGRYMHYDFAVATGIKLKQPGRKARVLFLFCDRRISNSTTDRQSAINYAVPAQTMLICMSGAGTSFEDGETSGVVKSLPDYREQALTKEQEQKVIEHLLCMLDTYISKNGGFEKAIRKSATSNEIEKYIWDIQNLVNPKLSHARPSPAQQARIRKFRGMLDAIGKAREAACERYKRMLERQNSTDPAVVAKREKDRAARVRQKKKKDFRKALSCFVDDEKWISGKESFLVDVLFNSFNEVQDCSDYERAVIPDLVTVFFNARRNSSRSLHRRYVKVYDELPEQEKASFENLVGNDDIQLDFRHMFEIRHYTCLPNSEPGELPGFSRRDHLRYNICLPNIDTDEHVIMYTDRCATCRVGIIAMSKQTPDSEEKFEQLPTSYETGLKLGQYKMYRTPAVTKQAFNGLTGKWVDVRHDAILHVGCHNFTKQFSISCVQFCKKYRGDIDSMIRRLFSLCEQWAAIVNRKYNDFLAAQEAAKTKKEKVA